MTEKRRPLTPQERGRLGGLTAAQNMTPDERKRRASRAGQAALEKHGPALYVRMNYRRNGRLPGKGTPITKND